MTLISINSVLENVRGKIDRGEPLRMDAFLQLQASVVATANNPLINLVRDMVCNLKKSAATLVSAPSLEKIDPMLVVCKCKSRAFYLLETPELQTRNC